MKFSAGPRGRIAFYLGTILAVAVLSAWLGYRKGFQDKHRQDVIEKYEQLAARPRVPQDDPPAELLERFDVGEELVFYGGELPLPLSGFPGVTARLRYERIRIKLKSGDKIGIVRECDGTAAHFLRAQTKVKVIDPKVDGPEEPDPLVEVRVLTGPAANRSVFVPSILLSRAPVPRKLLVDVTRLSEQQKRAAFAAYLTFCNDAFRAAGKQVAVGHADLAAALRTKRYEYELAARKSFERARDEFAKKESLTADEFDACVWYEIEKGWSVEVKDD